MSGNSNKLLQIPLLPLKWRRIQNSGTSFFKFVIGKKSRFLPLRFSLLLWLLNLPEREEKARDLIVVASEKVFQILNSATEPIMDPAEPCGYPGNVPKVIATFVCKNSIKFASQQYSPNLVSINRAN
jgi:hypothetical protein